MSDRSDTPSGHCQTLVRERERDGYLSILFAPAEKRPALFALRAFALEIARVRDVVSDPLPGEVRLQWWRDCLAGEARGDATAHPVAAPLLVAVERYRLPRKALIDLIDARTFDLYDDPMPSVGDLEGYCGETASALIRLSSLVLADGGDPGKADAAGHAGVAVGLVEVLRQVGRHTARGQVFVPVEYLKAEGLTRESWLEGRDPARRRAALGALGSLARRHLEAFSGASHDLPTAVVPAFLVVAAAEADLKACEAARFDILTQPATASGWWRQWRMWRLARRLG